MLPPAPPGDGGRRRASSAYPASAPGDGGQRHYSRTDAALVYAAAASFWSAPLLGAALYAVAKATGRETAVALAVIAYLAAVVATAPERTGRWASRRFQWRLPLFSAASRYFGDTPLLAAPDVALSPARQYVFALFPHGVLAFPMLLFAGQGTDNPLFVRWPWLRGRLVGLAASVVFRLPVVREAFLLAGLRGASRRVAQAALREGASLYLCPGGVAESLIPAPGTDRVVAAGRRRQGVVRLALAHRAPLVPVYTYRLTDTYSTAAGVALRARAWLCRRLGLCLLSYWGRWGTGLPHAVTLSVAVGPPVPLPPGWNDDGRGGLGGVLGKGATPTAATAAAVADLDDVPQGVVDAYQRDFLAALVRLFEAHKAEAGYPPQRQLEVLDAATMAPVPLRELLRAGGAGGEGGGSVGDGGGDGGAGGGAPEGRDGGGGRA
jgi:hypothetical protein